MLLFSVALLAVASALPSTTDIDAYLAFVTYSDPNVKIFDFPAYAKGALLGFQYGEPTPSEKLAVFDFDGTLGNPLECGGQVCPDDVWDGYREWRMTFGDTVRSLFRNLTEDGFKIAIVSNQSPLKYSTSERKDLIGRDVPASIAAEKQAFWIDKLVEFCQVINYGSSGDTPYIPLQVFGLLDQSKGFYKPCSEWWNLQTQYLNGNIKQIDCEQTFFVGDADARLVGDTTCPWQNGSDSHSPGTYTGSDHQFALSAGLQYMTPEQIFLGYPAPTPNQIYQPAFEGSWCNKGSPTPWCLSSKKPKSNDDKINDNKLNKSTSK